MTFTLKGTIMEDPTAGPPIRLTEGGEDPAPALPERCAWTYSTLAEAQSGLDSIRTMFWELELSLIDVEIVDSDGINYPTEASL
jgi:hypothetical protein